MKKIFLTFYIITSILLFSSFGLANEILSQNTEFFVFNSNVIVKNELIINSSYQGILEFYIPKEYNNLRVYLDEKEVDPVETENTFKIYSRNLDKIYYEYSSRDFIDSKDFIIDFKSKHNISHLLLQVHLRDENKLDSPIKDNALNGGSIYPKPNRITSDGIDISFIWEQNNFNNDDSFSIYAKLAKDNRNTIITLLIISFIVLFLFSIVYILFQYKSKTKSNNKDMDIVVEKENNDENLIIKNSKIDDIPEKEVPIKVEKIDNARSHLIAEEREIYDVLERKEGSCEQSTLVIATGIPKSTLSRVLFQLEERNFIYREKVGKKNIVHLKKEHWDDLE